MKFTIRNQAWREQVAVCGRAWLIGAAVAATMAACDASPDDIRPGSFGVQKSALEVKTTAAKAEITSERPARLLENAESGLVETHRAPVAVCFPYSCPPPSLPGLPICSDYCGSCFFGSANATPCFDPPTPPPKPTAGPVVGWVEGFTGNTFHGWACDKNVGASIDVHFYLDQPAGVPGAVGPLVVKANVTREAAVARSCQSWILEHGWTVDVTPYKAAYAGRTIFVYGLSVSGGSNLELGNSRTFTIPR